MPIERDPRFKKLFKEYKCKCCGSTHSEFLNSPFCSVRCDKARCHHTLLFATVASAVTSPLYVIALSMQMSIIPNLTIYGDVNPKDINKGLLTSRLGLSNFVNRKAIATSEKQVAIYSEDAMGK